MRDIGKNIRTARVQKKLTQDELAERLHVSRQTVSNYETGRSRPDVEMLLSIAEQLETDIQILLYGQPLQPERRRAYRLLAAEAAVTLVLCAAVAALWLRLRSDVRSYMFQGAFAVGVVGFPIAGVLLGWTLLQAGGTMLGTGRLRGRWVRPLHIALWALLAAYAVPALTLAYWDIQSIMALTALKRAGGDFSYVSSAPAWLDSRVIWWILYGGLRARGLWVAVGAALWLTKPERKNPEKQ